MQIECVEDVVVNDNGQIVGTAFIKGKVYRAYKSTIKRDYDVIPVLCAKNELRDRIKHVVKYLDRPDNDEFFNRHFRVIGAKGLRK